MENVYLCVMHSGTFMSKCVRFFANKGSQLSHVGLSLSPSLAPMYSFGRKYIYFAQPGGFVSYGLGSAFYNKHPDGKLLVYKMSVTDDQYNTLCTKLEPFIKAPKMYKYGNINCALHMLNKPCHRKHHFTCTTFVADMLEHIVDFDKDSSLLNPVDFCKLDLPLIYDGYFKDYNENKFKGE